MTNRIIRTNIDWDKKPKINEGYPIVYTIEDGDEKISVGVYFKSLDHRLLVYGYSAISYNFYASVHYKGDINSINSVEWETPMIFMDSSDKLIKAATSLAGATKQFYLSELPEKIDHLYLYGY